MNGRTWTISYEQGKSFYKNGQYEDAIKAYSDAISMMPDIAIFEARSLAYEKAGNLELAMRDSKSMLELNHLCSRACLRIARLYCLEKRYSEAYTHLRESLARIPASDDHYDRLRQNFQMVYEKITLKSMPAKRAKVVYMSDPVLRLPYEINIIIFSFLSTEDILRCRLVRRCWNLFCSGERSLWRHLSVSHRINPRELANIIKLGGVFVSKIDLHALKAPLKPISKAITDAPNLSSFTWNGYSSAHTSNNDILEFYGSLTTLKLTSLDFSHSNFNAIDLKYLVESFELRSYTNVKTLYLCNCTKLVSTSDIVVKSVKFLSSLTELNLSESRILARLLTQVLSQCTSLKKLYINNISPFPFQVLAAISSRLDKLEILEIALTHYSPFLDRPEDLNLFDVLWFEVGSKCTLLKTLNVSGHPFSNDTLSLLLANLSDLEVLNISKCGYVGNRLSPSFLSDLTGFASKLKYFDLSRCRVTSDSFKSFFQSPDLSLEIVILKESSWLTNECLLTLSKVSSLKCLVMDGCPLITDYGVKALLSARKRTIEYLVIKNCRLITDSTLRNIMFRFPPNNNKFVY